jgi:hypothetical protein
LYLIEAVKIRIFDEISTTIYELDYL